MSWTGRVLVAAGFAYGRTHDLVERAQGAAAGFAEAFLGRTLDRPERAALSIALYDARAYKWSQSGGLFDWEAEWLGKRLPRAPAKVLVAAAGAGREALALARLGYEVHAFDPAPSAVRECVARLGGRARAVVATYEDLSASVLDGLATRADPLRDERYDAVLLGWGSLCHVLDPTERERALRACAVLAPTGPLLCTFPMHRDGRAAGRAARWGRRMGEPLGRIRGARASESGDALIPEVGFRHGFTRSEIEQLAECIGRRTDCDAVASGWRCVTFSSVADGLGGSS